MKKKLTRRDFLKISAVLGAATLSGIKFNSSGFPAKANAVTGVKIPTCCNMCGGQSGVYAHVVDGAVVKIEPNMYNPINVSNISSDYYAYRAAEANPARICGKGNAAIMSLYDPDRVKTPLKRTNPDRSPGADPGWVPISYDQAIDEISLKLEGIRNAYGPQSLIWFSEDHSFTHIQEDFCQDFGTPNYLNHSNLCDVARKAGFKLVLGHDRPLPDLKNSRYILLFGWNPLAAMKWSHLPRIILDGLKNGAKLNVVDPRLSETAQKAIMNNGRWIQIKPGTDGALALAIANYIIKNNLHDQTFINNWTVGFADFKAYVVDKTPQWAQGITGVPATTIETVARELATTKPAVIDAWSGATHHGNGTQAARAIACLALLIGQVDKPGTLIIPERKGGKHRTLKAPTPSIPRVDGRGTKYPFAHSSGVYVEARDRMIDGYYTDPSNPSKTYPLKAAFFVFQNFVFNTPNSARNIQAIKNMELVVVVDTHLSETAMMADYVIPGTTYLERYDINPNWTTFPSVGLRRPVIKPIFGQLPEYDFVIALGKRMKLVDFPETLTYEQYLDDELRNGIGIGLADLMDENKFPGSVWIGGDTRYQKYATGLWTPDTPSRKFEFRFSGAITQNMIKAGFDPLPKFSPAEDVPNTQYPFYLINWKEALHTHSRTMNNKWLMEQQGENILWINSATASSLGIADGDMVWVENQYAKAKAKAKVTGRIRPDVIGMIHGFGHWGFGSTAKNKGTNDTQFLSGKAERLSGMARHKECAVKVYKA